MSGAVIRLCIHKTDNIDTQGFTKVYIFDWKPGN